MIQEENECVYYVCGFSHGGSSWLTASSWFEERSACVCGSFLDSFPVLGVKHERVCQQDMPDGCLFQTFRDSTPELECMGRTCVDSC